MFLLNSTGLGHLCFRLALSRSWAVNTESAPTYAMDSLVDHFDHFSSPDLFEYALTGWLLAKLIRVAHPVVPRGWSTPDLWELCVGLWCFDTLRRLQCNAHAITEVQEDLSDVESISTVRRLSQMRIATGLFPSVSMLNHSCEPSVVNDFHNGYIILRCVKPIGPGDEVFNCYGPHYEHHPDAANRKSLLREQYYFECDCMHCTKPDCSEAHEPSVKQTDAWQTALTVLNNTMVRRTSCSDEAHKTHQTAHEAASQHKHACDTQGKSRPDWVSVERIRQSLSDRPISVENAV
ncbi:unnamed protein product [Echinostoma caproni]|uniref:SET domain-containing protein n=1 Tax=Echinostoma caproni TaxID=27848 RepID=A0A183AR56_9TREM|nr:unnamed protein product [Echinostoma caproni]